MATVKRRSGGRRRESDKKKKVKKKSVARELVRGSIGKEPGRQVPRSYVSTAGPWVWVVETAVMADPHLTVLLSSEDGKVGLPLSHLEGLPPLPSPSPPLPLPPSHPSSFV